MRIIASIFRYIFSLRYKVRVSGSAILKNGAQKLFLPNHQAIIDPQLLFTEILRYTDFIPMVSAKYLKTPLIGGFFKKMHAIEVSNAQSGNVNIYVVELLKQKALKKIAAGNNLLIYPAGQMAGQGFEKIFNKTAVYSMVKVLPPQVQVVGVRISGLWGSMWSKAWNGKVPPVLQTYLKGLCYLLANLIFLAPRRKVLIEFEDITHEAKIHASRGKLAFNNFLEGFYNTKAEPVNYLKHFFFVPPSNRKLPRKIEGSLKILQEARKERYHEIPPKVFDEVKTIITNEMGIDHRPIYLHSSLILDLHLDSVGLEILVSTLKSRYPALLRADYAELQTVGDVCRKMLVKV